MPISKILLLTGESEAGPLTAILRRTDSALPVQPILSLTDLETACAGNCAGARLLSFCSNVIVPAAILARLEGPAYNFHPGPPERPGRYPAVFALYEGAVRFGVTVHEMAPQVDSGPIVAAEWFDVPPGCDLSTLESLSLTHLATIFGRLSPYLTRVVRPLPRLPIAWQGRRTTRAECESLCTITADMDEAERTRRQRACGILAS